MSDDRPNCDQSGCDLNFDGKCDGYSNTGSDVCPDISNSDSSSSDGDSDNK
jgi:hypothetical protein